MHPYDEATDTPSSVSFWPGLIDLVTSALMVFLLLTFIQTALDVDEVEALVTRQQQSHFLEQLRREFEGELEEGEVSVRRHLNFLQITFSENVLFRSGEHRLQPRGHTMLRRCAGVLEDAAPSGYRQIQVEGHTDSQPISKDRDDYPRDNWELSVARAISVVRFLTTASSLDPHLFSANGYAEQRPVASNATAEGRSRNRRIELRIFFALDRSSANGSSAG